MSDYVHHEMFPIGEGDTPFRKLTEKYVGTAEFEGRTVLKVATKALTVLAHKLARAVYYIWKKDQVFDQEKFLAA